MLYALGLKKFIELREASKPPKPFSSSTFIEIEEMVSEAVRGEGGWPTYQLVPRKRKMTLSSITFAGGKRLGVIKPARFTQITKVALREGGIFEIPEEFHEQLKQPKTPE